MKLNILLTLALALPVLAQLPDPALTPGAVRTSNAAEICAASFRTKPFRKTTAQMKSAVCHEYHLKNCHPGQGRNQVFEYDHLIPLEIGGMDDVRNLWPQLAVYPDGALGFHEKDELENELRRKVCDQEMGLSDAQECIRHDWISCYQAVLPKPPSPLP